MSTRAYSHRFCQSVAAAWTMLMRIEDSTRQKSWRKRKVSTLPWKKCSGIIGIIGIIESTTSKHNLSASQHDPLLTIEMSDPFYGSSCSTCPDTSLASCFMRCRGIRAAKPPPRKNAGFGAQHQPGDWRSVTRVSVKKHHK